MEDIKNESFTYPIIVKPRTFAGSKGVCKINNIEELLCFGYAQGKMLGSMKATDVQQKQAIGFAKRVNRDLKIRDGVFHLESFYKDNDFDKCADEYAVDVK